ncbi:unnamed protein product, partial [Didymodactylos carnosus]
TAACSHCYMAYRTHSKKDNKGKRKNYGLNGQNVQTTTSATQSKFAYNKKVSPEKYKLKLKDAELKFVVAGSHSFNSLENDGILKLDQTAFEIGANIGLVDVKDIFYGRQTIRDEALSKFDQYSHQIRSLISIHADPAKQELSLLDNVNVPNVDMDDETSANLKISFDKLSKKFFSYK